MTRRPQHSYIIIDLAAVILAILLLNLVYTTIDKKLHMKIQTKKEYLGDIETPGENRIKIKDVKIALSGEPL